MDAMDATGLSIIGIVHLVLIIWALWDLFTSQRTGCSVIGWLIVIVIFPWLGPILYLLFGRSRSA
jgi:hypothetical protein